MKQPFDNDIAGFIDKALSTEYPTLFAGAGVGCRAGYPDWSSYINSLAQMCETHNDPASAALIRERVARSNLLGAATVYKTCDLIPVGERWKGLAKPFERTPSEEEIDRLVPLASLPFCAIVTTNYDSSLHQAHAKNTGKWCIPVERGDGSLRTASNRRDFFIARIHGRAEMPEMMVVDEGDYRQSESDESYIDFLLHVLRVRSCLFIGFSFLDPAIAHILSIYKKKCGQTFSALHRALIPHGENLLKTRLLQLNIAVMQYDPGTRHEDLWRGIRLCGERITRQGGSAEARPQALPRSNSATHRLMAFAYSQIRTRQRKEQRPLAELVKDGVVLSFVPPKGGAAISEEALAKSIGSILGFDKDEADLAIESSLTRLVTKGHIQRTEDGFVLTRNLKHEIDDHLSDLAGNVLNRVRVREGLQVGPNWKEIATAIIERVLLTRAWDVSAHFAGADCGLASDLNSVVRNITDEEANSLDAVRRHALYRAVLDLLTSPEKRETDLLAKLSKAAFGLQLVLSTPRQVLFQRHSLPERIYLDASVLMPAITSGHPLSPVYVDCLKRLSDASIRIGGNLEVIVGHQFLNEIISHRGLATELVRELSLEVPDRLTDHILLYGATNTNVYVAAYSTHVGRERRKILFLEFLREVAPYNNEQELGDFLSTQGISTLRFIEEHYSIVELSRLTTRLETGYRDLDSYHQRSKPIVLIKHEAEQLLWLKEDGKTGKRSLFITADTRFRRVVARDDELRWLSACTLSHIGLLALVEVMVGADIDDRATARLIWSSPLDDEKEALFEYFVKLALNEYSEGMGMELEDIAGKIATEAAEDIKSTHRELFSNDPTKVVRNAKLIGEYQDKFFENWRGAIERRERQE